MGRTQAEALAAWEQRKAREGVVQDTGGRGSTQRDAFPKDMHETRELQPAVIELAKARGWMVYHTHDSRRSEPGFPDLVAVRRQARPTGDLSRLLFVELKSAKGVVTEAQQAWVYALFGVEEANDTVEVHLWRPEHWHDGTIEEVLR